MRVRRHAASPGRRSGVSSVAQAITHFASPERGSPAEITEDAALFADRGLAEAIPDASPFCSAVLNEHRQVVYCNPGLLRLAGAQNPAEVHGKRPGEILRCVHSAEMEGGCGTADACRTCGAALAILSSLAGKPDSRECRLTHRTNGNAGCLDLRVFTTPITRNGRSFSVFYLLDISHEKRRRVLERLFFHDVLNTAHGLRGLSHAVDEMALPANASESVALIHSGIDQLVDEIESQQQSAAAEACELAVRPEAVRSLPTLEAEAARYRGYPVSLGRDLVIDPASADAVLVIDPALLHRVLGNMIKNALEATGKRGVVTAGCREVHGEVEFWVHNAACMSRDVQLQHQAPH